MIRVGIVIGYDCHTLYMPNYNDYIFFVLYREYCQKIMLKVHLAGQ